jgi:hypothetical protein
MINCGENPKPKIMLAKRFLFERISITLPDVLGVGEAAYTII